MKNRFLILLFIVSISPAFAFNFSPISMDFEDSGSKAAANFEAHNTGSKTIALKITVHKREMDVNGKDILTEAGGDFLVYPARMVLDPGKRQRIRVQYKGPSVNDTEQAYRIIVEQIDLEDDTESAGLNLLYRYIGSLYVLPDTVDMNSVEVSSIQKTEDGNLLISITNSGNSHVILNQLSITFSDNKSEIRLSPEDLVDINGINILAQTSRTFIVSTTDSKLAELDIQATKARMEFTGVR